NAALSPLAEDEAALKAIAIDRLPEHIGRLARMPVLDQFDAEQEATPAHIADLLIALRQGTKMALEAVADRARLCRHVLALDDIEAGDPGGAGERVIRVRMRVDKPALEDLLLDGRRCRNRAAADAAAKMLPD